MEHWVGGVDLLDQESAIALGRAFLDQGKVQAGNIHLRNGRRIVVTLANHLGVFYESLPHDASYGSGGYCGPGAHSRFLHEWGPRVSRMEFNGAHKLYRREREKRWALERRVRELEAALQPSPAWWERVLRAARGSDPPDA